VPRLCEHATREFDDNSLQLTPTRHTAPARHYDNEPAPAPKKTSRDRQGVGHHTNPALTPRARQTHEVTRNFPPATPG
ncbi:MAG: hypothetical protein WCK86_23235, partial [Planctomycetia bacterium]